MFWLKTTNCSEMFVVMSPVRLGQCSADKLLSVIFWFSYSISFTGLLIPIFMSVFSFCI